MVVLAASICTRGGKAVLSRQFMEMQRSRIEGLLAAFPKLAASGTQHTTVEQDNVRYVYQPLDELYMVLITNRQSNILQDIDSLQLFAQVVQTICKSLDEREILKHAFELLSAFDELVTLGYRENLTLSQIKTFLEMESHEERIQEIIARNKELEASEERKRKAKQLEMQRREAARTGRSLPNRPPSYATFTPPSQTIPDTYNSYKTENTSRAAPLRGKGMQLGKKSKTNSAFDQIKDELGPEQELAPISSQSSAPAPSSRASTAPAVASTPAGDREAVHISLNETISAQAGRDGALESISVKGTMALQISDSAFTKIRLNLAVGDLKGVKLTSHPKVDKSLFLSSNVVQAAQGGFPKNQSNLQVVRWALTPKDASEIEPPITFSVWADNTSGSTWSVTVQYEWTGPEPVKDTVVSIPYGSAEPSISSIDAVYEVSGDSIDWTIGTVDDDNSSGSFELEIQATDESEIFPLDVQFNRVKTLVDIDVVSVTLVDEDSNIHYSKDSQTTADKYQIV